MCLKSINCSHLFERELPLKLFVEAYIQEAGIIKDRNTVRKVQ